MFSRLADAAAAGSSQSADRMPSLDGLRGVAAAAVVLHHCFLTSATIADPWLASKPGNAGALVVLLEFTPLHAFWAGTEAVFVFFVLSGLVLTLPSAQGRSVDWTAYYARRLIRLYLPVFGAVVLASCLALIVKRHAGIGDWWLQTHVTTVTKATALRAAAVLPGPTALDAVLWSLRWEVIFSLALPLYLLLGRRLHGRRAVFAAGILVSLIVWGGRTQNDLGWGLRQSVDFLAIFGLGVLLAYNLEFLIGTIAAMSTGRVLRHCSLPGLALLSVGLLTSAWLGWLVNLSPVPDSFRTGVARATGVAGACLIALLAVSWRWLTRLLRTRFAQWLGLISFSLYLVHDPIVASVAYVWHGRPPLAGELVLAVPLSMLAAQTFHRLVERPSQGLSRYVATKIHRRRIR